MRSLPDQESGRKGAGRGIPIHAIALDDVQQTQTSQEVTIGLEPAPQGQMSRHGVAPLWLKQCLGDRSIHAPLFDQIARFETVAVNVLDAIASMLLGSIRGVLSIQGFKLTQQFQALLRDHQLFCAHLSHWNNLWQEIGNIAIASRFWNQNLNFVSNPPEFDWSFKFKMSAPLMNLDQIGLVLWPARISKIRPRFSDNALLVTYPPCCIAPIESKS